jgi:hypothetical protein
MAKMPTLQYLSGWVIFGKEPMENPHICPCSHKEVVFILKRFHCYVMNIEWIREGMMIVKEGVVSLNNVGIIFHVFRLLLKIAEIAQTLK